MRPNADITVFNKYIDPTTRTEVYQRASIKAVVWENRKGGIILVSGGQMEADLARVFIPFSRGSDYMAPAAWQALATKTGKWTLQIGDVVVRGVVADEITSLFTVSKLKAKYGDVLIVSSVNQNDAGSVALQHWEVGAK